MSIALDQFKALVNSMYAQKKKADEANQKYKDELKILEGFQAKVLAYLEENELQNFKTDLCTVSQINKMSVKVPKETSDKEALFNFIKTNYGEDVLINMLSINSNSFNAFYNAEEEKAVKQGEFEFNMPGVEKPKMYTRLGVRKV